METIREYTETLLSLKEGTLNTIKRNQIYSDTYTERIDRSQSISLKILSKQGLYVSKYSPQIVYMLILMLTSLHHNKLSIKIQIPRNSMKLRNVLALLQRRYTMTFEAKSLTTRAKLNPFVLGQEEYIATGQWIKLPIQGCCPLIHPISFVNTVKKLSDKQIKHYRNRFITEVIEGKGAEEATLVYQRGLETIEKQTGGWFVGLHHILSEDNLSIVSHKPVMKLGDEWWTTYATKPGYVGTGRIPDLYLLTPLRHKDLYKIIWGKGVQRSWITRSFKDGFGPESYIANTRIHIGGLPSATDNEKVSENHSNYYGDGFCMVKPGDLANSILNSAGIKLKEGESTSVLGRAYITSQGSLSMVKGRFFISTLSEWERYTKIFGITDPEVSIIAPNDTCLKYMALEKGIAYNCAFKLKHSELGNANVKLSRQSVERGIIHADSEHKQQVLDVLKSQFDLLTQALANKDTFIKLSMTKYNYSWDGHTFHREESFSMDHENEHISTFIQCLAHGYATSVSAKNRAISSLSKRMAEINVKGLYVPVIGTYEVEEGTILLPETIILADGKLKVVDLGFHEGDYTGAFRSPCLSGGHSYKTVIQKGVTYSYVTVCASDLNKYHQGDSDDFLSLIPRLDIQSMPFLERINKLDKLQESCKSSLTYSSLDIYSDISSTNEAQNAIAGVSYAATIGLCHQTKVSANDVMLRIAQEEENAAQGIKKSNSKAIMSYIEALTLFGIQMDRMNEDIQSPVFLATRGLLTLDSLKRAHKLEAQPWLKTIAASLVNIAVINYPCLYLEDGLESPDHLSELVKVCLANHDKLNPSSIHPFYHSLLRRESWSTYTRIDHNGIVTLRQSVMVDENGNEILTKYLFNPSTINFAVNTNGDYAAYAKGYFKSKEDLVKFIETLLNRDKYRNLSNGSWYKSTLTAKGFSRIFVNNGSFTIYLGDTALRLRMMDIQFLLSYLKGEIRLLSESTIELSEIDKLLIQCHEPKSSSVLLIKRKGISIPVVDTAYDSVTIDIPADSFNEEVVSELSARLQKHLIFVGFEVKVPTINSLEEIPDTNASRVIVKLINNNNVIAQNELQLN